MEFPTKTRSALSAVADRISALGAVVGPDGFVDRIVTPVGRRTGPGDAFTPIGTIDELGRRISAAAGKSSNFELYPRMEKIGGNGPIMANALATTGLGLRYFGALGTGRVHPVFKPLVDAAREVVSFANPGETLALEFSDGKLMLGIMSGLDDVTWENTLRRLGKDRLTDWLENADLVALVNWTMIPGLTEIFRNLAREILPNLTPRPRRFFFDLADPEKRSPEDLRDALDAIAAFSAGGRVTLGLNLKEAQQVLPLYADNDCDGSPDSLRSTANSIREALEIDTVVVHPKESAACATPDGVYWVPGPYTETPRISTGAGDHFNAGFSVGQVLGLSPEASLGLGVCFSGYYVRNAASPTLDNVLEFLDSWKP